MDHDHSASARHNWRASAFTGLCVDCRGRTNADHLKRDNLKFRVEADRDQLFFRLVFKVAEQLNHQLRAGQRLESEPFLEPIHLIFIFLRPPISTVLDSSSF